MKIPIDSLQLLSVLSNTPTNISPSHRLLIDGSPSCDSSFLQCLLSATCRSCFSSLQENSVDWTNVVPDTPCQDVLGFLTAAGHCLDIPKSDSEKNLFCSAFDACVVWDEKEGSTTGTKKEEGVDCSELQECTWEGMHEHFLGDGICHDSMPGCYNSKVCNYDGGDCCEDTCHYPGGVGGADAYGKCGQEGYACRDPKSGKCQPALARLYGRLCDTEKEMHEKEAAGTGAANKYLFDDDSLFDSQDEVKPECSSSQSLFRLVQFDSWGDGWDNTILTFAERGSTAAPIYKGGLKYGSQGTKYICLTKSEPKCYHIQVENGVWGNEISWELRPLAGGAPILAAGGSPTDCTVPLGGLMTDCPNNCDKTRPDTNINDPNYKSYKDMEACLEKKCLIQAGACSNDDTCAACMTENTPQYCFANDNFNALIDCSMCSCAENRPQYCDAKSSSASGSIGGSSAATHEGNIKPAGTSSDAAKSRFGNGGATVCGPEQTIKGTQSLIKFSECADVDKLMAMLTEFDNDNFGMLDLFEDCATTYENDPLHGGKNALDCMKILHNIILDDDNESAVANKGTKGEALPEKVSMAISNLAHHLYNDAESFCNCASDVNKEAPTCAFFINLKTLLYESVDACRSLDAIDCAAWEEFYTPCKKNLMQMYDSVNFENKEQCSYVENTCGGAGPFPAFRRLDCAGEIAKAAWDFHTMYSRGCLKSTSVTPLLPPAPSGPVPVPKKDVVPAKGASPAKGPVPPKGPAPKPTSHVEPWKPTNSDAPKPYLSPSDPGSEPEDSTSYSAEKSSHLIRNALIFVLISCVAGYAFIKRRRQNFNYYRFRQMRQNRNYGMGVTSDGGGEYSGVSMADSCSFEPPSLPPTPNAMI